MLDQWPTKILWEFRRQFFEKPGDFHDQKFTKGRQGRKGRNLGKLLSVRPPAKFLLPIP